MSKFNNKTADELYDCYYADKKKLEYVARKMMPKVGEGEIKSQRWHNPSGMEYIVIVESKRNGWVFHYYMLSGHEGRESVYALSGLLHPGHLTLNKLTYHFLQRYKQRFIKLDMSLDRVLIHYVQHNPVWTAIWQSADKREAIMAVDTGLEFACLADDDKTNVYCTFVSNDMLKEEQREAKERVRQILMYDRRLRDGYYGLHGSPEWLVADSKIIQLIGEIQPQCNAIIQRYKDEMSVKE